MFYFPFFFVSVGGENAKSKGFLRDPDGFDFKEPSKLALILQNFVVGLAACSGEVGFSSSLPGFASSEIGPNSRAFDGGGESYSLSSSSSGAG